MSIKLRMSAVQYVHTKRFQSELMAFINHFSQIQESLRRMRTVAAGNEVRVLIKKDRKPLPVIVDLIAQQVKQWTTRFLKVESLNFMYL